MSIGQGSGVADHAGVSQLITLRQSAFRPSIFNFLTIGILGQIFNSSSPIVFLVQRHFRAIGQSDLQARRTNAILVASVVPDLHNCDFHGFDSRRVSNYKAIGGIAGHFAGVLLILKQFLKGIVNKLTLGISLIHLLPGKGPVVCFLQRNDSTDQFAISIQGNLHTFRTEARNIFFVFPYLGYGNIDLLLLQGVRQRSGNITISIYSGLVASLNITGSTLYFNPLITDWFITRSSHLFGNPLRTVPLEVRNNALVLCQTSYCCRPTVFFRQIASDPAIGQLNFQFVRTGAMRVVIVFPDFVYGSVHLFAVRICMELDVTVRHQEPITRNTGYLIIPCC